MKYIKYLRKQKNKSELAADNALKQVDQLIKEMFVSTYKESLKINHARTTIDYLNAVKWDFVQANKILSTWDATAYMIYHLNHQMLDNHPRFWIRTNMLNEHPLPQNWTIT